MPLINTYPTFEAMLDYYQTVSSESQGIFKSKGSKFIAYCFPVSDIGTIDIHLEGLKTLHPKSRHVCYSYSLGLDQQQYRINDDGEPSGTAGRPIYNEILSNELTDILIAVVRYFGGTKLGVPGLINAYKTASQDALKHSEIITKYLTQTITVEYKPKDMGRLYDIIKRIGIEDIQNEYGLQPTLILKQRRSKITNTIKEIYAQYHGYGIEDISDDFESPALKIELLTQ